jgi:hypothetical protein
MLACAGQVWHPAAFEYYRRVRRMDASDSAPRSVGFVDHCFFWNNLAAYTAGTASGLAPCSTQSAIAAATRCGVLSEEGVAERFAPRTGSNFGTRNIGGTGLYVPFFSVHRGWVIRP